LVVQYHLGADAGVNVDHDRCSEVQARAGLGRVRDHEYHRVLRGVQIDSQAVVVGDLGGVVRQIDCGVEHEEPDRAVVDRAERVQAVGPRHLVQGELGERREPGGG
jgi:hypothetical protein